MKIEEFITLKKLNNRGIIKYNLKADLYHKTIIDSNIPFKPGVYLIYAVKNNVEKELLYIGKAGHTKDKLNAHPLPARLLAPEQVPVWHKNYSRNTKRFLSRAKFMPEKVRYFKLDGINIYWFQTYPDLNSNAIEVLLKNEYRKKNNGQLPIWMNR